MTKCVLLVPHKGSVLEAEKFINNFLEFAPEHIELYFGWNGPIGSFDPLRYSMESRVHVHVVSQLGSYKVRNRLVEKVNDEITHFAFTDSDCIVDPTYFKQLDEIVQLNPDSVIAGDVRLFYSGGSRLVYNYETILEWDIKRTVEKGGGITANLIVPRMVFDTFGKFDEDLFSGADNLFCKRISKLHTPVVFNSDLFVSHPSRPTMSSIASKKHRTYFGWFKIRGWDKSGPLLQLLYLAYPLRPPVRPLKRIFQSKEKVSSKLDCLIVLIFLRLSCFSAHLRYLFTKTIPNT
jgi:hypothetical protein